MATFQLFFQSDRAKDLSTPLYLVLLRVLFGSQSKQYFHLEYYMIAITEMEYIYCALRPESIITVGVNLSLETVSFSESVSGKLVICYPVNSMHRF